MTTLAHTFRHTARRVARQHAVATAKTGIRPSWRYRLLAPIWEALHRTSVCSVLLMLRPFESVRWHIGRIGARIRFHDTLDRVPAYKDFVNRIAAHATFARDRIANGRIPVTDKANYVQCYHMAARCIGGVIPQRGVLIDESSGSSGQPTNWIRGAYERNANARTIRRGLEHRFGRDPLMVINSFALGPWATGINLTLALASWCRLKALGPDVEKIVNTLRHFGPTQRYLIMGYPPFLKQLLDRDDIDWSSYQVSFVCGGEGMSESMRRHMQSRGVSHIYGSFGASDLELNIAAETDFTIALRRLLEARPEIAQRLLARTGSLPMIFQYNPAEFFLESTADGELLVTICRPGYVAPKVRYNIHDLGHVVRMPALKMLLAEFDVDISTLDPHALNLPLLFHYGRSDLSVAWYGCKISPADIQEVIYRAPELSATVDDFKLTTTEDAAGDKQLTVSLEVVRGFGDGLNAIDQRAFFDALASVNQDFRESRRIAPPHRTPTLELFAAGTGPFVSRDARIKRAYLNATPALGLSSPESPTTPAH